ncbi:hypothetical protein F5Y07DRAFT_402801 [Xylaria sp. FL0933]|nr:hypothetical protein F5Y07DRAFT_402801 [Xylaria sp. FL0933]
MASPTKNARELFLPTLRTIDNDRTWWAVTQDLLFRKDRHDTWRLELDRILRLPKNTPRKELRKWLQHAANWAKQICLDMQFAMALFSYDEWDPYTLEDFMNIISRTTKLFRADGPFGKMWQDYSERFEDVPLTQKFDINRKSMDNHLSKLVRHVKYDGRWGWDRNDRAFGKTQEKVSAATLVELLVRNAVQNQRKEILSRLESTTSPDGPGTDSSTEAISKILEEFRVTWESVLRANSIPEREKKQVGFWHARMMAIVIDPETRIIVTGGTQAVPDDSSYILREVSRNMCRIRVGDEYWSVVHQCSEDFFNAANDIIETDKKETGDPKKLFDSLFNNKDASKCKEIPSSRPGFGEIRCWAFSYRFKLRDPCTRCQYVYSEWIHYDSGEPDKRSLDGLRDDWSGHRVYYNRGTDFPCSYCAETVAAAKLYALQNGVLTLVPARDRDELVV